MGEVRRTFFRLFGAALLAACVGDDPSTQPSDPAFCKTARDGTVCSTSPRQVCVQGTCRDSACGDGVVDPGAGEECDVGPGNLPNSGCEPTCKLSCHADEDCAGNFCGVRTCDATKHTCNPPLSPPSCDDNIPCTTDSCDPNAAAGKGACVHVLIDADKDGFAPASLGPCGSDCDDDDPDSFPGQTKYFTTPNKRGNFDYNCAGGDEAHWPALLKCNEDYPNCTVANGGWFYVGADSVPACGSAADWISECMGNVTSQCVGRPASTTRRTQECH